MTSASFMLTRPHVPPEDTPNSTAPTLASAKFATRALSLSQTDASPVLNADLAAQALSTAIAKGDQAAYEQLYLDWFDRWLAAARVFTGRDESFCLDVVQDTAIRVARSIRPRPTHAALEAWLLTVLRSCAIDHLRTEQRALKRALRASEASRQSTRDTADSGYALAEIDERIGWLRDAMHALPRDDADLLAQRFAAGDTLQSIASRASESRHAVHGRVRRLLQNLRHRASEFFHDP